MTPEWYQAVEARDVGAARALTHEDVRLGGAKGSSRGHAALASWLERSGIHLRPLARHDLGEGLVIMEEEATWENTENETRMPAKSFTLYAVRDGLLAAVLRHDSLHEARVTARTL